MPEQYSILGGKVHVYKRPNSSLWQCSSYFAGKNRRTSTKEESLSKAKEIAEDWYLQLRGKLRTGEIKTEKTFREASELFLREYDIITQGQRSKDYLKGQHWRSTVHLVPFFGHLGLSEITAGKIQEYRIHRHEEAMAKRGKPPAHNTMHQELVVLRQTLKTAIRQGWLDHLPDLSEPYRSSPKISHRAWFSPEEYKKLYEATRKRAHEPKQERYKWESEQLHDYVLFSANTGLRPDEARRLQFRDVAIVEDEALGQTILRSRCAASAVSATARACLAPCAPLRERGPDSARRARTTRARRGGDQTLLRTGPKNGAFRDRQTSSFRSGSASFSRRSSTKKISGLIVKAGLERLTACGTRTYVSA